MQYIPCNLCSSQKTEMLYTAHDRLYKTTSKTFSIVRCTQCGLVYMNPRPEITELGAFYPNEYKPHKKEAPHSSYHLPASPKRKFIDIGCGSGKLMIPLGNEHPTWEIHGVDTDKRAVDFLTSLGFPTHLGTLEENHFEKKSFDEANMEHVLEHVPDPLATLKETYRILKPNSTLTITIPNFRSMSRILFGSYWYSLEAPRHLYHFTPTTLSQMLKEAGFKNISVTYISSPKYFLQSFALWKYGKKSYFPKFIWRTLAIPAKIIALLHLSSTIKIRAQKG